MARTGRGYPAKAHIGNFKSGNITSTQTETGVSRLQQTASQTETGVGRVQKTTTRTITGVGNIVSKAISVLFDDFTGTVIDTVKWGNNYVNGGSISQNGIAIVTPATLSTGYNAFYSTLKYDLTGQAAMIEVLQVCNVATAADTFYQLAIDANNDLEFIQEGGTLYFRKNVAGVITALASVTYDAVAHLWWRFRESAGTTYWETSADGISWTTQASASNPIAVISLSVTFGAGTYILTALAGSANFDNFNILQTTKTITGVGEILVTNTKTETGVARVKVTTTKTITGVARVTVTTTKTETGVARITITTAKTQTGVSRIQKTVTQNQTGVARVQKSVSQTISGVARVTISTSKTITGVARVQKTTTKTETGVARITATSTQTETGKARVTISTTKTETGIGRVLKSVSKTITGVANLSGGSTTRTKTETGVARVSINAQKTITGVAAIATNTTTRKPIVLTTTNRATVLRTMGTRPAQITTLEKTVV